MSGIFTRLKDRFVHNNNNNRNNSSNRPPDNPHLSITRQSTRSNTTFCNAPMEPATFNSIVQDATHTRAVPSNYPQMWEILMTLYWLEVCINHKQIQ